MAKLHLVVARIDGSLRLLTSRVIRTSRFSMVVDLDVVGPAVSGDLWRLDGLGMHPVVIKRVQRRGPIQPPVRVSPTAAVPVPRRPLSPSEQVSWASVARGSPAAVVGSSSVASSLQVADKRGASTHGTAAQVVAVPADEAEEGEICNKKKWVFYIVKPLQWCQ